VLSFVLGDIVDAVIILGIVVLSGLLSFWQEHGANATVARLLTSVRVHVDLERSGRVLTVPPEVIVSGGVLVLNAGDIVPCDCWALTAAALQLAGIPAGHWQAAQWGQAGIARTILWLVNGLEGARVAAEMLTWVGVVLGPPLLLVGIVLRVRERALVSTQIVIVDQRHTRWARWCASGRIHERPLRGSECVQLAGRDFCIGYVSPDEPWLMQLERCRPMTSVCRALGATFVLVGLCGFTLSLVSLLLT
jgi:hypothetical protein